MRRKKIKNIDNAFSNLLFSKLSINRFNDRIIIKWNSKINLYNFIIS